MIVQDLFRDIDIKKLAETLVKNYEMEQEFVEKHSFEEYCALLEITIKDFLSIEPLVSEDYLVVHMVYDLYDDEDVRYIDVSIVHKDNVVANAENIKKLIKEYDLTLDREREKTLETYGTTLVERKELMGLILCEHCLEKHDKYEILAAIFDEYTFFGYLNETNEEKVEEESAILQERIDEIKEHPENLIPMDEAMKEIFGEDWKKELEDVKRPTREELDRIIIENRKDVFDEVSWIIEKLNI